MTYRLIGLYRIRLGFAPSDKTTSHSTKPPYYGGQVAGYSHKRFRLSVSYS